MDTSVEERRKAILTALAENRLMKTADLSRRFGVSEVLIRRDFARMEQQGLLRRVRGGAMLVPAGNSSYPAPFRAPRHLPEKQRIGRAAADLIGAGERLIIDSGATALELARHIPDDLLTDGNLTVITSSLPVVQELGTRKTVHLILLGGVFLPEHQVAVGPQTIEQIRDLHADKMFLGADGLTLSHGLTTANVLEAEVDRAMVDAALQVIAVADSSKIGRIGLSTIIALGRIHVLVTDKGAPAEFVAQVRSLGVEVILA
jgi:DeoR family transcriptional regulator, aga operon transcriptional repressor